MGWGRYDKQLLSLFDLKEIFLNRLNWGKLQRILLRTKTSVSESVTLCSHFWSMGSFIHSLSSPMVATLGWASPKVTQLENNNSIVDTKLYVVRFICDLLLEEYVNPKIITEILVSVEHKNLKFQQKNLLFSCRCLVTPLLWTFNNTEQGKKK